MFSGTERAKELIQAQLQDIGVEMSLSPVTDFFGQFLVRAEKPASSVTMQRQGTGKVTRTYGAGSPVNVCTSSSMAISGSWS
jgi:hypothetical protein